MYTSLQKKQTKKQQRKKDALSSFDTVPERSSLQLKRHHVLQKNQSDKKMKTSVNPSLFATAPDTAHFWSGRYLDKSGTPVGVMNKAAEIAKSRGGVTLETLIDSRGIKMPEWDIKDPSTIKAWQDASAAYANQVSGKVCAVLGSMLRPGNIWEDIELPRLRNNDKVNSIVIIDPVSLQENTIMEKNK